MPGHCFQQLSGAQASVDPATNATRKHKQTMLLFPAAPAAAALSTRSCTPTWAASLDRHDFGVAHMPSSCPNMFKAVFCPCVAGALLAPPAALLSLLAAILLWSEAFVSAVDSVW